MAQLQKSDKSLYTLLFQAAAAGTEVFNPA